MLPALLAAMFMAQFDLYVVNVAGPRLQSELHVGQAALELIVAGYGFTYASGLVTGGRLGDLFGPRRMFISGTLAFTVASLLCGLAQNPTELVVARLVQGLAGALMVPQVLATITAVFPPAERARALSWFGVTIGVGSVAGQVLGGLLLQWDVAGLGWRPIFLVNVPIGLASAAAALWLQPRTRTPGRSRIDPLGALGISGSLALALAPLALGRAEGWPAWTWISLAASVPVMAMALRWQRSPRNPQPLVDLTLFRDPTFTRGLVIGVAVFAGFFSLTFTLSLLLQNGLGLTPLQAGLTFCPLGLAFAIASISAQRLAARHGLRLVTAGIAVSAFGNLALWLDLVASGADTSVARLIAPMVMIGAGNGLGIPPLIGTVLSRIQPRQAGSAAGILTTSQQFAAATGVTAIGSVFFAALGGGHDIGAHAAAMQWVLGLDVALMAVAATGAVLLARPAKPVAAPAAAAPASAE